MTFGAKACIERISSGISPSKFGYKIQAIAAHVLLRLGYRIDAINRSGHPDIIAIKGGREYRFEVEAESTHARPHKLTDADFALLVGVPAIVGYYALAIQFPAPYWVLVPALKLTYKTRPSSNVLLEALSDKDYSKAWTREYVNMLHSNCRQIELASFDVLCERALTGRGL